MAPNAMSPSSRRFLLRHGSWAMHQQLDAKIGTLDTPDAYKRYLYTVYLLRTGTENTLQHSPWPEYFKTWRPTYISPALLHDLQDLGLAVIEPPPFPPVLSLSALLGALYVVEGASLGARILVKQAAALGFTAQFGARHLAQQTTDSTEWATYLQFLDDAPDFYENEAIQTAQAVFSFGLRAFSLAEQAMGQSSNG